MEGNVKTKIIVTSGSEEEITIDGIVVKSADWESAYFEHKLDRAWNHTEPEIYTEYELMEVKENG